MRLPLLDLLAHTVYLAELGDVCFEENDLPILVQCRTLVYDLGRGGFVSSDEVCARSDTVLDEGFQRVFADTACATNYATLSQRKPIKLHGGSKKCILTKQRYKSRTKLAETSIGFTNDSEGNHDFLIGGKSFRYCVRPSSSADRLYIQI